MDLGLKEYRILVTASSSGIGYGIAEVLVEQGAWVVVNGRREDKLLKAWERLRRISPRVERVRADLSIPSEAEELVDRAAELLGGLDSVVYVTGSPRPGRFMDLEWSDWRHGIGLLVESAIGVARRSVRYLVESSNPSLVYSTSIAVKEPIPDIALSNVLRISVHGLVKTLSRELAPKGIRVNAILPGYIDTERIRELVESRARREDRDPGNILEEIKRGIPLGRIGEPREVGYLAAFLLSPYARFITGAFIPVDGGQLRSVY